MFTLELEAEQKQPPETADRVGTSPEETGENQTEQPPKTKATPPSQLIRSNNGTKKKPTRTPRKSGTRKGAKKKPTRDDGTLIMVGIRMTRPEKNKLKATAALAGMSIQEMVREWISTL